MPSYFGGGPPRLSFNLEVHSSPQLGKARSNTRYTLAGFLLYQIDPLQGVNPQGPSKAMSG